jgi:hypothetical protein
MKDARTMTPAEYKAAREAFIRQPVQAKQPVAPPVDKRPASEMSQE